MDLKTNAFRTITEKAGFDINAGQNIDASKTLKEMIEYVERYIDENHKGCCFHASVYLMKLLHEAGIESEIILTAEPTVLENGETRTDMRASVMINDGDRYIVMNPIEDIEFFEKNQIPTTSRKDFYEETVLQGEKSGIHSVDAASIELEDFITRYGEGRSWTIGSFYRDHYDTITFGELMNGATFIDIDEYQLPSSTK